MFIQASLEGVPQRIKATEEEPVLFPATSGVTARRPGQAIQTDMSQRVHMGLPQIGGPKIDPNILWSLL